jgi:hypothetical protein
MAGVAIMGRRPGNEISCELAAFGLQMLLLGGELTRLSTPWLANL